MSVDNDNHILFYFENSCIISYNKIGILLNLILNFILSNIYIFVKDIMGKYFFTTGLAFGHVTYNF